MLTIPWVCFVFLTLQVMGLRRQKNYAGRWDILIQQATQCLNRLIEIAARKRRNYILDQVLLPEAHCPDSRHSQSMCPCDHSL